MKTEVRYNLYLINKAIDLRQIYPLTSDYPLEVAVRNARDRMGTLLKKSDIPWARKADLLYALAEMGVIKSVGML